MSKAAKTAKTKKPPQKPKKTNGYNFPERLPEGEILRDIFKNEWILGPTIGKGGFGEIYSANKKGEVDKTFPYAVKIEPQENGPLFVEKHFYVRYGSREDVESWKKSKKLKLLGMPNYYSTGTHDFNGIKYRYLVMERYGQNLWNLFVNNNRKFPTETVYKVAIQTIDTLNYIHDKELVHGDIKGANLVLGIKRETENHVFLVDFGLACKYTTKDFKYDPKKAHNGTIEYTSCDWHQGVPTRRGDFEILGYNMLQWLNSTLPWEKDLKNKDNVYDKKKQFMENIGSYMDEHFPDTPKVLRQYFEYISRLKHNEAPDYKYCKDLFIKELNRLKVPLTGKLDFSTKRKHKLMSPVKDDDESDEEIPKKRKTPNKIRSRTAKKSAKEEESVGATALSPRQRVVATALSPRQRVVATALSPPQRSSARISNGTQRTPAYSTPVNNNQFESDEDIFFTPDEINVSSTVKCSPKKNDTPKIKKTTKKKLSPVKKISWRDAPSVRAGLTLKAGLYVKNNTATKKK